MLSAHSRRAKRSTAQIWSERGNRAVADPGALKSLVKLPRLDSNQQPFG
jgi:hypothetical protein